MRVRGTVLRTQGCWVLRTVGSWTRGEQFAFDGLSASMHIFRENLPEVVDRFELLAGGEPFGGYSYVGAAYFLAPQDLEPLAEKQHGALSGTPRCPCRPSPHAEDLRGPGLARNAIALYRALNGFRTVVRAYSDLPPAPREIS